MARQNADALSRQAQKFQRRTLNEAGLSEVMELLRGQLGAARDLPLVDPALEATAVAASRAQASEQFRTAAAARPGGLSAGASTAGLLGVGAALAQTALQLGSAKQRGLLRRFQLQGDTLGQLSQAGAAGISASPAGDLIRADAQIQAAEIQAAAMRSQQLTALAGSVIGGFVSGGAGVLGASILAGVEEED